MSTLADCSCRKKFSASFRIKARCCTFSPLWVRLVSSPRATANIPYTRFSLSPCGRSFPDFRGLRLTHNGANALDRITGTQKLHCEVFFLLPLAIEPLHPLVVGQLCQALRAYAEVITPQHRCGSRPYRAEDRLTNHKGHPYALKNVEPYHGECESISHRENRRS